MPQRKQKTIAFIIAIGCVAVTGVLAVVFWEEIAIRYYVYHLRFQSGPARDDAFRRLIAVRRHRGQILDCHNAEEARGVKHVVECPQPNGGIILCVVTYGESGDSKDPFTLIDMDGSIISVWEGYDLMQGKPLSDVNGDGSLERIEVLHLNSMGDQGVDILIVLPMTREQLPILLVGFNYLTNSKDWGWRLAPTATKDVFDIELGALKDLQPGCVKPQVVFRWSADKRVYIGPHGGKAEAFSRLSELEQYWQLFENE